MIEVTVRFPVVPGWDVGGVAAEAAPGAAAAAGDEVFGVASLGATAVRYGDGSADRVRAAAHADLEAGRNRGKIVLLP